MRVYQRVGAWYIDYSFEGRRVRKMIGRSREEAELALKEANLGLPRESTSQGRDSKEVLFEKMCEEYLSYSKANKRPQSYRRDQVSIANLLGAFFGRPISEISAFELERYKNLRRALVAPATVNRELSCIKHMFNMAVQWNLLGENRLRLVKKFREPAGRVRYLDDEQLVKLVDSCANHLKPIVIMAVNTGMRKGEILTLKWADVDLEKGIIMIKNTKNNETRILPLNKTLGTMLTAMNRNGHQHVFVNGKGHPFDDVKSGFASALKRAAIADFRFHDLRHTFASKLVMAGVDIRTVQELMGHKDIKMTMRYSHLSDRHLREAVAVLDLAQSWHKSGTDSDATKDDKS